MSKNTSFGIRTKLVIIFILIKVLPLLALAWFAWHQLFLLVEKVEVSFEGVIQESQEMGKNVVQLATKDSILALDEKSREAIERLAFDTAQDVARFLYERDHDIQQAAMSEPSEENYRNFLASRKSPIIGHERYIYNHENGSWQVPPTTHIEPQIVQSRNKDNAKDFHSLAPDPLGTSINAPLFLEMTFVDLAGNEKIKVTTSELVHPDLRNISQKDNTFCKAENYFQHLKELQPGEIYVSDVIGAYQTTHLIGPYSKSRTEKAGIAFSPQNSAYAGKENPVGKRFQGLVRWATPVERNGKTIGFVTLALDHTHLMEFTDHTIPTIKRYSAISNAATGNYTFMWDYLGRNISHPRDYFITGYDPETGEPALPWLEAQHYEQWKESNFNTSTFLATLSPFENQTLEKKPSLEQIQSGYVALDCRFLNFAPQCDGWMNLTQYGGSGSFLIFWSGLWKLTTAASIPYFTGQYVDSPRGFGFVTIGANVNEFHKAAMSTAEKIEQIGENHGRSLDQQFQLSQEYLKGSFKETTRELTISTVIMIVVVIIIAIWMASVLTGRITKIIHGIRIFQKGDLDQRLDIQSGDELDELALTFNSMADNIQQSITDIQDAFGQSETANKRLVHEVATRKKAEKKLEEHRDTLEDTVSERTWELEQEILERKQALDNLKKAQLQLVHSEKLAGIGQIAAGIAHEINTPIQYIRSNIGFFQDAFDDIDTYEKECDQLLEHPDDIELETFISKRNESKEEADLEYLREELPQSIEQTLEGVDRVADIVLSIKTFSHPGIKEKIFFDINEALENTITVSSHAWKYVAEMETELDKQLPEVLCLPGELNQVFLNLITNAAFAISDCVGSETSAKGMIRIVTCKKNDNVEIAISDSGQGIPEEIQSRVFEPFFTTKEVGKGTGQGLAISWTIIVGQHSGKLWFDTGSKGTTFYISLPLNVE